MTLAWPIVALFVVLPVLALLVGPIGALLVLMAGLLLWATWSLRMSGRADRAPSRRRAADAPAGDAGPIPLDAAFLPLGPSERPRASRAFDQDSGFDAGGDAGGDGGSGDGGGGD